MATIRTDLDWQDWFTEMTAEPKKPAPIDPRLFGDMLAYVSAGLKYSEPQDFYADGVVMPTLVKCGLASVSPNGSSMIRVDGTKLIEMIEDEELRNDAKIARQILASPVARKLDGVKFCGWKYETLVMRADRTRRDVNTMVAGMIEGPANPAIDERFAFAVTKANMFSRGLSIIANRRQSAVQRVRSLQQAASAVVSYVITQLILRCCTFTSDVTPYVHRNAEHTEGTIGTRRATVRGYNPDEEFNFTLPKPHIDLLESLHKLEKIVDEPSAVSERISQFIADPEGWIPPEVDETEQDEDEDEDD